MSTGATVVGGSSGWIIPDDGVGRSVPTVAVRGEVVREVPPELARFTVTVAAHHADRQVTLDRLTQRVEAVRQLIDRFGAAVERRETGELSVLPERKRRGERVSAYHGSLSTVVTVTDFTVLGELMLAVAEVDQSTVQGPWWELRPDSPVLREARRAAIADAMVRAQDYAQAVGARLEGVLEISDVGLSRPPEPRLMAFAASDAGLGGDAGALELHLEPQLQTVYGQVEMRFRISEPTAVTEPVE